MTLEHTLTTKIENGEEKECLRLDFTNGALQQLEDLKAFIGAPETVEVIRTAIGLLQRIKDNETNKTNSVDKNMPIPSQPNI